MVGKMDYFLGWIVNQTYQIEQEAAKPDAPATVKGKTWQALRLAGIGIPDTVSGQHVDLNRGLVSSLYNPYAAVPSMHVGYALIVAAALLHHGRHLLVRALGALYPPFVLLVIVATGNHFFLDAAAGALVAGLAAALAALLTWRPVTARG